jgi:hypothetical protein
LFHIQRVTLSHDKNLLASCSLDDIVKIVDVSHLQGRLKENFDEEEYENDIKENPKVSRKKKSKKDKMNVDGDDDEEEEKKGDHKMQDNDEGWTSNSDDDDDSDDSDDSSDDDMEE